MKSLGIAPLLSHTKKQTTNNKYQNAIYIGATSLTLYGGQFGEKKTKTG